MIKYVILILTGLATGFIASRICRTVDFSDDENDNISIWEDEDWYN